MMRLTRAAVAVLSALLLAGPLALNARTAQAGPCANVTPHLSWTTIAAPAFTAGGPDLTTYAVHPLNPSRILVTNGEQIFVTDNGGCDWRPFDFSLELLPSPNRPVSNATAEIVDIDIPEHPAGAGKIYITVVEGLRGTAVRPHVFVKEGESTEWKSAVQGLPPAVGGVWGLHIAPSDPNVVYLHVREDPATASDDIYASLNGGDTWQKRSSGDDGFGSYGLAIDPLMADDLWTWGGGGLWHSADGGRSRSRINQVADAITHVDVFHGSGAPSQIMAYEIETFSFGISRDGGASWERIMGPGGGAPLSIAHGNKPGDIVFSAHGRVDRFKPPSFWSLITPTDYNQPDLHRLQADRTRTPSIFGMTPRTLERYIGLNQTVDLPGFDADVQPPVLTDRTSLQPAETKVALKAGRSKDVPYRFALPANPTPLDVFFLVDTTSSMESSIAGLRSGMQKIVDELAASKIDVQFGVGEVKDYPVPGYGDPTTGDFPYRLRREIGPPDEALAQALEKLEASGGGRGDYEESQLTGLYQAVTGEGEPGCAAQPADEFQTCVPPGQDANFRHDSLPVIVNITDYGFHDEPSHPSPTFQEVAEELRLERAKQIGLAIFGTQGWQRATTDLQAMAEATGTLTPPGGVDCDGNGAKDIHQGDPLVCQLGDMDGSGVLNIAPAIIATVKAVAEEVKVELVTSDDKVIDVDKSLYPAVDVTQQNSLGFGVTFTCPRALAGTKHNLNLAAHVQGQPVATASAKVVCKGIPAAVLGKRREKEPPPLPPPLLPVFPPAAVAIPAIAPAGPPPVPETISSTQSAAQAQGAIAKQEQEQIQVAVAIAQFKNNEAYALSSYTERRDQPSPLPLYLTAVVMSLGAGAFAIARRRVRTSVARRRY